MNYNNTIILITLLLLKNQLIDGIDSYTIKKAMGIYDSPLGSQIQTKYEKEIQQGVEKIAKECIDGAKATKIATEIAAKVAPVLTCALFEVLIVIASIPEPDVNAKSATEELIV